MSDSRQVALSAGLRNGRFTRRTAIRSLAGLAAASSLAGGATTRAKLVAAQQSTPSSIIQQFYLALATYRYKDAYALLGSELQTKQTLDAFTKGYADTAYVQAQITGGEGTTGQQDVQVNITAWHNDGSVHAYSGSYTLNLVGTSWKIAAASITEDVPPQNVAPLIRFANLNVSLGEPDAAMGHRYFHLLAKNNARSAVTAAGVPHLKLLNATGGLVMDSSPGQLQPIAAVTLQPGQTADAQFEWSNWCEAAPSYPLRLQIAIPGDTHELVIPFTTPLGPVQAPPCMGAAEQAVFQSMAFHPAGQ